MSIVIYTNPKNGCKYAYESTYQWSKEHQQSRPKRKYLGRVDDDGNIIYSSGKKGGARVKSQKTLEREAASKENAEIPSEDAEKYRLLYEQTEKDRQECKKRIQALEAEVSELKQECQRLSGILSSIHSITESYLT
ncbi:MAG: hypothetical protein IIY58_00655 [Aeriscardovia sp.]|nr:hypothetical protein [Aeriscardovia sp.]